MRARIAGKDSNSARTMCPLRKKKHAYVVMCAINLRNRKRALILFLANLNSILLL